MSKKLVKIDTDAPGPFNPENLKRQPPDNSKLSGLFKKLEFRQLQRAFPQKADLSNKNYRPIFDMSALSDLLVLLETAEIFAVATETLFEKPDQLKARHPELYEELQYYYKVDPADWVAR